MKDWRQAKADASASVFGHEALVKKGLNDNYMLSEFWYVHDKGLIREHEEKLEQDLSRKGTRELVVVAMEGGALPEAPVKPKLQGVPPDVKTFRAELKTLQALTKKVGAQLMTADPIAASLKKKSSAEYTAYVSGVQMVRTLYLEILDEQERLSDLKGHEGDEPLGKLISWLQTKTKELGESSAALGVATAKAKPSPSGSPQKATEATEEEGEAPEAGRAEAAAAAGAGEAAAAQAEAAAAQEEAVEGCKAEKLSQEA